MTELTKALESVEGFISSIVSKLQLSMLSMGNYRCIRSVFSVLRPKLLRVLKHLHSLFHMCKTYRLEQFRLLQSSSGKFLHFSFLSQLSYSRLSFLFARFLIFCGGKSGKKRRYEASYSRGAILIMLACFLPIILLGIKYSEKLIEEKEEQFKKVGEEVVTKRCAQEAALEVARNWNPGLTLSQQQEGVYKVADAVYNEHPCYRNSTLEQAIPGFSSLEASRKQVLYDTGTYYINNWWWHNKKSSQTLWNQYGMLWLAADIASNPDKRKSAFDELDSEELANCNFVLIHHDIYTEAHPHGSYANEGVTYPSDSCFGGDTASIRYTAPSSSSTEAISNYDLKSNLKLYVTPTSGGRQSNLSSKSYKIRKEPSSGTVVEVEVSNDKIKVKTDEQEGYAIPAQCNVDIVLAVPVNGAASNENNRDTSSETEGDPYRSPGKTYVPTEAASTPLYQMGQALKSFVKTHFYHTRGVNMSLIPYSGKVSISPDRATAWTVAFPSFVDTSTDTQLMIGACLYGTSGVKDAALKQDAKTKALLSEDTLPTSDTPYYWGGVLTGCPIMFRAGVQQTEDKYGGNSYFRGFLANYSVSGTELTEEQTNGKRRLVQIPSHEPESVLYGVREPADDEVREEMHALFAESVLHDRADSGFGQDLRDVQRTVSDL